MQRCSCRPDNPVSPPPRAALQQQISERKEYRIALSHAIDQIEQNAINLAFETAVRYSRNSLLFDFVKYWLSVANDESRRFLLLSDNIQELGGY